MPSGVKPGSRSLGGGGRHGKSPWGILDIDRARKAIDILSDNYIITPEQIDTHAAFSPERQLWITVLAEGAKDILKGDPQRIREMRAWVWQRSGAIMGFRDVCDHLGIDVEYARQGFLRLIHLVEERQAQASKQEAADTIDLRHHQANSAGRVPYRHRGAY